MNEPELFTGQEEADIQKIIPLGGEFAGPHGSLDSDTMNKYHWPRKRRDIEPMAQGQTEDGAIASASSSGSSIQASSSIQSSSSNSSNLVRRHGQSDSFNLEDTGSTKRRRVEGILLPKERPPQRRFAGILDLGSPTMRQQAETFFNLDDIFFSDLYDRWRPITDGKERLEGNRPYCFNKALTPSRNGKQKTLILWGQFVRDWFLFAFGHITPGERGGSLITIEGREVRVFCADHPEYTLRYAGIARLQRTIDRFEDMCQYASLRFNKPHLEQRIAAKMGVYSESDKDLRELAEEPPVFVPRTLVKQAQEFVASEVAWTQCRRRHFTQLAMEHPEFGYLALSNRANTLAMHELVPVGNAVAIRRQKGRQERTANQTAKIQDSYNSLDRVFVGLSGHDGRPQYKSYVKNAFEIIRDYWLFRNPEFPYPRDPQYQRWATQTNLSQTVLRESFKRGRMIHSEKGRVVAMPDRQDQVKCVRSYKAPPLYDFAFASPPPFFTRMQLVDGVSKRLTAETEQALLHWRKDNMGVHYSLLPESFAQGVAAASDGSDRLSSIAFARTWVLKIDNKRAAILETFSKGFPEQHAAAAARPPKHRATISQLKKLVEGKGVRGVSSLKPQSYVALMVSRATHPGVDSDNTKLPDDLLVKLPHQDTTACKVFLRAIDRAETEFLTKLGQPAGIQI